MGGKKGGREVAVRWTGAGAGHRVSVYNTHNQKEKEGKDKERLGLRGRALHRRSEFVVQNRFFTAHFRRHMRRYNQIPPDDLSLEIRPP